MRSREGAAMDDECDSIVVMVVTDEGDDPADDDEDDELEHGGCCWTVVSGEDEVMIRAGAAVGVRGMGRLLA